MAPLLRFRARAEGRSEEELIAGMSAAHQKDFDDFGITFDNYGSTNSANNKEICGKIWAALRDKGPSLNAALNVCFDLEAGTFLADRFVKGTQNPNAEPRSS